MTEFEHATVGLEHALGSATTEVASVLIRGVAVRAVEAAVGHQRAVRLLDAEADLATVLVGLKTIEAIDLAHHGRAGISRPLVHSPPIFPTVYAEADQAPSW